MKYFCKMYLKKNLFTLFIASLLILAACKDNPDTNVSNQELEAGEEVLSSDLVNNPNSEAGEADMTQSGLLVFEDTIHDFGTIKEGEVIQHEFEYTNKGTKEVIITHAKGSCGCTVPEYDLKPIPPGGVGIMKVTFNSQGRPGYNEKNVQITTNGVPSKYRLTILAKVQ